MVTEVDEAIIGIPMKRFWKILPQLKCKSWQIFNVNSIHFIIFLPNPKFIIHTEIKAKNTETRRKPPTACSHRESGAASNNLISNFADTKIAEIHK